MGGKLKPPCLNPLFSSFLLRGREVSHQIRVMFYVAHFGASTSSSEQWETSWRILSIGWASVWHKIRTIWVPDVLIRVNSVSFNLGFHFLLSLPVSHSWELARELLGKIADWKKREGIFEQCSQTPNDAWCSSSVLGYYSENTAMRQDHPPSLFMRFQWQAKVHPSEPGSLFQLLIEHGWWVGDGHVGELKAATLEGLSPTWMMAVPGLCRYSWDPSPSLPACMI